MRIEWPINEEAAPDQILLRNRAPIATVVTVVTVVAHRKIAMLRDGVGLIWPGKIIAPKGVASVRRLGRHDTTKSSSLTELAITIKQRGIDTERVARKSRQALDKKRRARLGIVGDTEDVVGAKNKDVAAMRLDEIVTKLVDKNLVPGVDGATGNDIAAVVRVTR